MPEEFHVEYFFFDVGGCPRGGIRMFKNIHNEDFVGVGKCP